MNSAVVIRGGCWLKFSSFLHHCFVTACCCYGRSAFARCSGPRVFKGRQVKDPSARVLPPPGNGVARPVRPLDYLGHRGILGRQFRCVVVPHLDARVGPVPLLAVAPDRLFQVLVRSSRCSRPVSPDSCLALRSAPLQWAPAKLVLTNRPARSRAAHFR